jgi:hypothetical protein
MFTKRMINPSKNSSFFIKLTFTASVGVSQTIKKEVWEFHNLEGITSQS